MTEEEWLGGDFEMIVREPLTCSEEEQPVSDRKLRLWAAACCRLCWGLLKDKRSRVAVEAAERFADGLIGVADLAAFGQGAREAGETLSNFDKAVQPFRHAALAADDTASPHLGPVVGAPRRAVLALVAAGLAPKPGAQEAVLALLRDIVGNPFRPVKSKASWLKWNGGTVPNIAQGIYQERAFERLRVLADALEDAGCADAELLGHLRGPGPHVRGCWALDLILGRE
jgi:hypothetical protein